MLFLKEQDDEKELEMQAFSKEAGDLESYVKSSTFYLTEIQTNNTLQVKKKYTLSAKSSETSSA